MKKLIYLLFLFLPFFVFADILPEPSKNSNNEIEIIDEEIIGDNDAFGKVSITGYNWNELNNNGIEIEEIEEIEENEEIEEIDINWFTDWWMSMLAYWFCNEWFDNVTDSLNAAITQQTPFKVCFIWENYADVDLTIEASLVSTTQSDLWNDVCWLDTGFQSFLTSGELGIITIPADNYVIKEFDITFPLWYEWTQKWCLVYSMYKKNDDEWWVWLKVVMRKWLPMNFFVWAIDWIKNELTVTDLTTRFDENKDLILSFYVENTGNMENTFEIQWAVKWLFWYNKKFEIIDWQVAPNGFQYVEVNLWSLPSYGWKYSIDFTINGTPYFSYDISNANVDPARLEPKSWEFSTSVFKMPWLILAVVVIFILLLIVLFKKPKQKVVYVQQQPTQPIQPQQPMQPQQVQPQQPMQQPTQQYSQPVQPSQPVQQPVQPTQPVQPQQPQNPNYPNQQ